MLFTALETDVETCNMLFGFYEDTHQNLQVRKTSIVPHDISILYKLFFTFDVQIFQGDKGLNHKLAEIPEEASPNDKKGEDVKRDSKGVENDIGVGLEEEDEEASEGYEVVDEIDEGANASDEKDGDDTDKTDQFADHDSEKYQCQDDEVAILDDVKNVVVEDKGILKSADNIFIKNLMSEMARASNEAMEGMELLNDDVGSSIDDVYLNDDDIGCTEYDMIKVSQFFERKINPRSNKKIN